MNQRPPGEVGPGTDRVRARPYASLEEAAQAAAAYEPASVPARLLATLMRDRHDPTIGIDPETGMSNNRGWLATMGAEEERCRRHDLEAGLVALRVCAKRTDAATVAARVIRAEIRGHDTAARLGPDEFAVLATHCDEPALVALTTRLADVLAAAGLDVRVGSASRRTDRTLMHAWAQASNALDSAPA